MNAIQMLKQDHKTVEALFKQFEKSSDRALKQRELIVKRIIRELAVHAAIEETTFYPAVRKAAAEKETKAAEKADDTILESLEEHHIVKWTLSELEKMSASDERYEAKVTVLMESVRHHVEEEEEELFPTVEKLMDDEALELLGAALQKAKKVAPTHPHPRAPDEPPGNLVAGGVAAVMDRGRDMIGGMLGKKKTRGAEKFDS